MKMTIRYEALNRLLAAKDICPNTLRFERTDEDTFLIQALRDGEVISEFPPLTLAVGDTCTIDGVHIDITVSSP